MVIIKPENYPERISSLTVQDWIPLLELIPKIERIKKFGDSSEAMKLIDKGIIDMHTYVEHEIVEQFRVVVYSIPIIIDFDWVSWDEGREIVKDETFDYDTIDIPTKCKIITALVRNDRFCDGVLVSAFESGMMLKVLRSIQQQLRFIGKA